MTTIEAVGVAGLVVSVVSLAFGVSGFVLGVMNYLRDRHRVVVRLQWDMTVTEGGRYDATKTWGLVSITNAGRRPAYLSHVALRLPEKNKFLVLQDSLRGIKLGEGDPPTVYLVEQNEMKAYSKHWRKITARVEDSTGKLWHSNRISEQPSWAREVP